MDVNNQDFPEGPEEIDPDEHLSGAGLKMDEQFPACMAQREAP
jgi:hypothetical protein